MTTATFSVEVITLPVSDVERALRFYVHQIGFKLDVDYSPNDSFRVVQLTPPGSSCSIQIGNGLTDAPVGSLRNIYLVVTDLQAARTRLLERGVEVGEIRHKTPIGAWDEVSRPDSIPRAETMPASPASPIRTATTGCYRNEATAMCHVVWKHSDVDHARCRRNTEEDIGADTQRSRPTTIGIEPGDVRSMPGPRHHPRACKSSLSEEIDLANSTIIAAVPIV
jgi:predicted enzyme related to lactoylglutathione lyase